MNEEKKKRAAELAQNIMNNARNKLIVNLRFMDLAVGTLRVVPYEGTFATDGKYIGYDIFHTLKTYKISKEQLNRGYLHIVLHCVFRHFFVSALVDTRKWSLACDIAVEAVISELNLDAITHLHKYEIDFIIKKIRKKVKFLTAEKIYNYLMEEKIPQKEMTAWEELFAFDDHSVWYDQSLRISTSDLKGVTNMESWKDISERIQTELETFSKLRGDKSGYLIQNLKSVNREKYDYSEFLKRFSVMGETMKVNDDEFDYIFYTYGLKMYERMPLVEPLEYKETKRIKEFAIVIDTSGSVHGKLVQKFINKTYNILKQEESFFTKINLHIIQCDAEIKEDAKITSQAEFDDYLKNMKLKGFGGTDFRPAFRYIDELIKNREFTNLKGIIYFTDGCGIFPARKPDYHTAFVYIDDEYNNPNVPAWAIKLVLKPDEI